MSSRAGFDPRSRVPGLILASPGVLALVTPLWPELAPARRLGLLLAAAVIFNLATRPFSVGTWQIRIDLGDGVSDRIVNISLRK